MSDVIAALTRTIEDRRTNPREDSYTSSLFAAGLPRMAQKVGEEGVETAVAALSQGDDRLIYEMADLVYHCLVLLAARGRTWADVEQELAARFKS
jgi:phosphoribosyl-ATP pyrophosphohydrolase